MAAGVTNRLWEIADIAALVEAADPKPGKRRPHKKGLEMRLADVTPRTIVYTSERVGDDKSGMEERIVFYIREPDGPCRYPSNVRIARIGMAQGDPHDLAPRYLRFSSEPCRDPGEADGRLQVHRLDEIDQWSVEWPRKCYDALFRASHP
jgi:hypothetical protein